MESTRFLNLPVIDAHVHFGHPAFGPGLMEIMKRNAMAAFNVVCTPHFNRLSLVPDALYLKAQYPQRTYVFGGLDISTLFRYPDSIGTHFARYVDTLLEMGCDGIKMIEGKPQIRKMLPVPPFDSPVWEPYWDKMERHQVPLLFHVNDPEEFWDAQRVPDWARRQGWFYGDGTYVNNEAQYREVLNVLKRHSHLKVIFAHFFFLSADLERLAGYLERFPNLSIDLVPGIEMYFNFARQTKKVREFFMKYADRILYGTDIGARALLAAPEEGIQTAESESRIFLVRSFLEREGPFWLEGGSGFLFGKQETPLQAIALPQGVLEKIYFRNFKIFAGENPKALAPAAIIDECARLAAVIPAMGAAQPDMQPDASIALQVKSFFENSMFFKKE